MKTSVINLLISFILSQRIFDLPLPASKISAQSFLNGDQITVYDELYLNLQGIRAGNNEKCVVNIVKNTKDLFYPISCSLATQTFRQRGKFEVDSKLYTQLPFVINLMKPENFDVLAHWCSQNNIDLYVDSKEPLTHPNGTLITFNSNSFMIINKECFTKYRVEAIVDVNKIKIAPMNIDRDDFSDNQLMALLVYCRSEHIKDYDKNPLNAAHVINRGKLRSIHKDCKQKYLDEFSTNEELTPYLPRYFFYIMSNYDLQRLISWCKLTDPSWISQDETTPLKDIIIDGKYKTITAKCYDEHVKLSKQKGFPMVGLSKEIAHDTMTTKLRDILHNWCSDFYQISSDDRDKTVFDSAGNSYSRRCLQAYRSNLHVWVDKERVDQETYIDMVKTCQYLGLEHEKSHLTTINVFSSDPMYGNDIYDERNYNPRRIASDCLTSFKFYTHGDDVYTEETFNPGAKVHLTHESIHLMKIAQTVGVLPVLGPLIASFAHGLPFKLFCTFFKHCAEPQDIFSGTYVEHVVA